MPLGELYVGSHKADSIDHLLFHPDLHFRSLPPTAADFTITSLWDEFHRRKLLTYRKLLEYYQPKILLGLHRTPRERMTAKCSLGPFGGAHHADRPCWKD